MSKIRVLIVDDSVVIRRLVSNVLSGDPGIEVVGIAANGRIALRKIPEVNPDLVTLDIEMPEMDGLETLGAIRKTNPRLPVIMFSTLTERGAAVTLDALSMGASDYVTKPSNVGSIPAGMQRIREELIPKIKALCLRGAALETDRPPPAPKSRAVRLPAKPTAPAYRPVDIVAIGVSTGGPNALAVLLPKLPGDLPVPVVIVQHMPPIFTRLLADRLAAISPLEVNEGVAGRVLKPGCAWVAPGGYHLLLERGANAVRLKMNQEPPENSCRPAVDVLFRSVAEIYRSGTLAVVLTGMGQDGLRGCEQIREVGGQVLVQDEASCVVWGMPGFVAKAGLADKTLPLDQLGDEVVRRVQQGRGRPAAAGQAAEGR